MSIEEIVKCSTEPLKGDIELRRKVSLELADHLDASVESFRAEGKSEAEAEQLAAEAFGDPELIGQKLLTANFRQLKRRAKIKLAVKILLIPAVLLALLLSIDFRSLKALHSYSPSSFRQFTDPQHRDHPSVDKEFAVLELRKDREKARRIYEAHRDDPVYRMAYLASEVVYGNKASDALVAELEKVRELEPDNAMYSYLLGNMKLRGTFEVKYHKGTGPDSKMELRINDQAKFEQAMKEIGRGLRQPHFTTYTAEGIRRRVGMPVANKDILDMLQQRLVAGTTNIYTNTLTSEMGTLMSFYGGQLADKGELNEANLFLNGYKTLGAQLNEDAVFMFDEILISRMIKQTKNILPGTYRRLGRPELAVEAAKQLDRADAVARNFNAKQKLQKVEYREVTEKRSGLVSGPFLGWLPPGVTAADLRPDLNIHYNLLDLQALAAMEVLISIVLGLFLLIWLIFCSRRSHLILMRGRDYGWILLWGIAVPLALYFLITRVDIISGRDYSMTVNFARWIAQAAYLVILFPVWALAVYMRRLRRYSIKVTGAKLTTSLALGNSLPMFAVILLCAGVVLRPYLYLEQKYNLKKDRMIWVDSEHPTTLIGHEPQVVNQLKQQYRAVFSELPELKLDGAGGS